jgi:hypothetical protein
MIVPGHLLDVPGEHFRIDLGLGTLARAGKSGCPFSSHKHSQAKAPLAMSGAFALF